MDAATGVAPAKLILLGEHSVVYGHPAIAVPLERLCAEATVSATLSDEPIAVELDDFSFSWSAGEPAPSDETGPFAKLLVLATAQNAVRDRGWKLKVRSRIPIGCGLGSSASVSAASFKAIFRAFGVECTPDQLSECVYETERILHGTPSGIDNTVVALERPVLFRKGTKPEFLATSETQAFLVVGYTGIRHKTRQVVGDVAKARESDRAGYDAVFGQMGQCTLEGVKALEKGDWPALGELMDRNQALLERIDVSSPELEKLIGAARQAGALGAKLSVAGRGGCMVALIDDPERAERLQESLERAGAALSIRTPVPRGG
jgi:mevalonate kinase